MCILKLLKSAITLRKRFAIAFSHVSSESDNGHNHFIEVLEEVSGILAPNCPEPTLEASEDAKVGPLANLFDSLELETPSQAFLDADATTAPLAKSPEQERFVAESAKSFEEQALSA